MIVSFVVKAQVITTDASSKKFASSQILIQKDSITFQKNETNPSLKNFQPNNDKILISDKQKELTTEQRKTVSDKTK